MKKNRLDYKQDFPRLISRLENMIIIGAFQPKERLVEADLAQRLEVSRAWIRDALKILETKGLVKMVPYRGAMVADLTEGEVKEIFQVRVVLERLCNQLSAENYLPEHGDRLSVLADKIEQAYGKERFDEMIEANAHFHDFIANISGNSCLIQMLKQIRLRFYIFNTFAWSNPEVVRNILAEHREYIRALEQGDYKTLDVLAESHISYSKDLYLRQLKSRRL